MFDFLKKEKPQQGKGYTQKERDEMFDIISSSMNDKKTKVVLHLSQSEDGTSLSCMMNGAGIRDIIIMLAGAIDSLNDEINKRAEYVSGDIGLPAKIPLLSSLVVAALASKDRNYLLGALAASHLLAKESLDWALIEMAKIEHDLSKQRKQ